MIGFGLTEEQQQLRDLAHDFAANEIRPVAEHYDRTMEYPWEVIRKAHELGLTNTAIPEKWGGLGLSSVDQALLAEEFAWGCTGIGTALEANGLALAPVLLGGSDYLLEKYVQPMTEEPIMAAYGVTEPGAGSDVAGMRSVAEKKGDKYILNGSKMWITNAGAADWYFVVAYTDKDKRASPRHDGLHRGAGVARRRGGQEGDQPRSALQRHPRHHLHRRRGPREERGRRGRPGLPASP